jgi:hypothetical protein
LQGFRKEARCQPLALRVVGGSATVGGKAARGDLCAVAKSNPRPYRDPASRLTGLVTTPDAPFLTANLFSTQDLESLLSPDISAIVYDFFSFVF